VRAALMSQHKKPGVEVKVAESREDTGADPAMVQDLIELHDEVGSAILLHKYTSFTLPTKQNRFDWTLGQPAVEFGRITQYDYAMFLHAQDTFSSGGRVALQVAGAVACGRECLRGRSHGAEARGISRGPRAAVGRC
jgi:hypothetical protein